MKLLIAAIVLSLHSVYSELIKDEKFQLNSGNAIPKIGLGTAGIVGDDLVLSVLDQALAAGYRHIDTAHIYNNEESIGKALKVLLPKHNLKREDLFITSKLAPDSLGPKAYEAIQESIRKLDCGYLDLYLIHWPGPIKGSIAEENKKLRDESWKQLVKAKEDNLTKSIGVSNYNVNHLTDLLANSHGVKPSVNQIEWHPFYHPTDVKELCDKEGILLEAYSSLGGDNVAELLGNEVVQDVAKKVNKSPAQVLLKWALQQNIAVIPKAKSKAHLEQNIDLNFEIGAEELKALSDIKINKKYRPNPDQIS